MIKTNYIETECIVFKKRKYLESSAILEVFTPIFGCKNFLVKGIFRKNKRFYSPLEQLSVNSVQIFYKENRELNVITKAYLLFYPMGVIKDLNKFNFAVEMIRILRKQKFPTESVQKLYELLKVTLNILDKSQKSDEVYHNFLEKYLDIEGYMNDRIKSENIKRMLLKERIKHYESIIERTVG
ncbi:MAG: DNA repair protein RecO [bacterium]|uniref:DNA repair protein recO n=2 Tax=Bacteria candidate phyla TaxID=1783234 RepID=A0A101I0L0_UNCT6|nr:MAG: DNA repair protein recO [candidate division TA06 bacterium 32_111]KUK86254.1 MAG: DNA repair protein recO [candidate division TA06 bacterium 34_109]MDI6699952.1 DNA repair protein RecO [bacterium]HAF08334.1 DNA repair protein RecO [candidate division WOR-3 bacterium]HCP17028.1 DNA repair protein RecO [candidate division WOR-3 bacterium]